MSRRWSSAIGTVVICLLLGAVPALFGLIFSGIGAHKFALWALQGMAYSFSIGVPCCLVVPRVDCALGDRGRGVRIAGVVAALAAFSVMGCFAGAAILLGFRVISTHGFAHEFWWSLRICLLITFTFGLVMTVIGNLQGRLREANEELHRRQMAEERERKIAAEARFASLESRVHPHFLFNTLNSISALIREDPAQAERVIERLAELLRFSLDSEVTGIVPLREELKIVRDYLEIEKVRFGDRLRYGFDVDAQAEPRSVPALSIQTLVQNSVKYAAGARREGADIVISARVESGLLRVEVFDDGPGFDLAQTKKPGHGIDLLERRLDALFGKSASLEIASGNDGTRVTISVTA